MSTGATSSASSPKAVYRPIFGVVSLICIGGLAVAGQLWNMRTSVEAGRHAEAIATAEVQRQAASQEWQNLDEQVRKAVIQGQDQLGRVKSETSAAQNEYAELAQKLGALKKDTDLARSNLDDLMAKQKSAQVEAQKIVVQKDAQEAKTRELVAEQTNLREQITRLAAERDQAAKATSEAAATTQKLASDINSSQKLLADLQKQTDLTSTKQKDLQTSALKVAAETEAILSDKAKAAQQRDALNTEVASLQILVLNLKTEREGLETDLQQLQEKVTKAKAGQLAQDKALAASTAQALEATRTLQQKRDEIGDLQQRVDTAKATEQKLLGELRRLSGIVRDGGAATQLGAP